MRHNWNRGKSCGHTPCSGNAGKLALACHLLGERRGVSPTCLKSVPRTVSQSLPVLGSVRNIPVLDPLRRPCTGGDPDNTSPSRHDVARGLCSCRPANGRSPADTRWATNKLSAHVPAPKPTWRAQPALGAGLPTPPHCSAPCTNKASHFAAGLVKSSREEIRSLSAISPLPARRAACKFLATELAVWLRGLGG
jgi:hypothetical protein